MSEELMFKRRLYHVPDQMVADVEKFLEWMKKHALKDEEVEQLFLDYGMVRPDETEDILKAAKAEVSIV